MNAYHVIFTTEFGKMALVWKFEKDQFKVLRAFLPQPIKKLMAAIKNDFPKASEKNHPKAKRIITDLQKFLKGKPVNFDYVSLDLGERGSFKRQVYQLERKIPRGKVMSYAELAKNSGRSKAVRAVGSFQARNPYPILIPCHRIIPSDRTLGSFQTGTSMKQKLLELEGVKIKSKNGKLLVQGF